MRDTKIRWTDSTWNFMTGCTKISPGCDNCYAEALTERWRGGPAFPVGFDPTFKPQKLKDPGRTKAPVRWFVNSLSDVHHEAFTLDQIDAGYDTMAEVDRHEYLVLTKRPQRMAAYFLGPDGWLARRGLDRVPDHIWLGTSIESPRYAFRAGHLRKIPVLVRFISAEPLIDGPLPLDLTGIAWVICGGESGNGSRNFRPMDLDWARALRDQCRHCTTCETCLGTGESSLDLISDPPATEIERALFRPCFVCRGSGQRQVAFFYKQGSAVRTEMHIELDDERIEEFPLEHPSVHRGNRVLGVYPFAYRPTAVTVGAAR